MDDQVVDFYSSPQIGGSMSYFAGARRGGGFFSTLARFALPILKNLGGRAINVAAKTATEALDGRRPFKEALVNNTMDEVKSVFASKRPAAAASINKEGEGDIFNSKHLPAKKRRKRHYATSLRKI